ncbi:hypothetical protein OIO90_006074 [Microbotryomycetes sp. JL221]|nr:hypothetical protein OIO90_006074 [Microbotryomycetes sp. JL221]
MSRPPDSGSRRRVLPSSAYQQTSHVVSHHSGSGNSNNNNNLAGRSMTATPSAAPRPVRAKVDPSVFATAKASSTSAASPSFGSMSAPSTPTGTVITARAPINVSTFRSPVTTTSSKSATPTTSGRMSPRKVVATATPTRASPKRHRSPERMVTARVPLTAAVSTIGSGRHRPLQVGTRSSPLPPPSSSSSINMANPSSVYDTGQPHHRRTTNSLSPTPPALSSSPGSASASSTRSPLTSPTLLAQRHAITYGHADTTIVLENPGFEHDAWARRLQDNHDIAELDSGEDDMATFAHSTPTALTMSAKGGRPLAQRRSLSSPSAASAATVPHPASLLPPLTLPRSPLTNVNTDSRANAMDDNVANSHSSRSLTSGRPQHTRSHSIASTTSSIFSASDREAMLSGLASPTSSWGFTHGHNSSRQSDSSGRPSQPRASTDSRLSDANVPSDRPAVGRRSITEVDWETTHASTVDAALSAERQQQMQAMVADTRKREDQKQRKIDDLEISNKSLLTINSSLERLKSNQAREIRDLRRRLRDLSTLGGAVIDGAHMGPAAALAAFRSAEGLPVSPRLLQNGLTRDDFAFPLPGEESNGEQGDQDDDDVSDVEPTWDEILASDLQFSAIATVVESLVKRGRAAIDWQVDRRLYEGAGRVLSADEVEEMRRLTEHSPASEVDRGGLDDH